MWKEVYLYVQLVELKNSETFNGHLVACDNYMNITLRDVYQTSPVCVHGMLTAEWRAVLENARSVHQGQHGTSTGTTHTLQIKYCRVADDLIDAVRESEEQARKQRQQAANNQRGHGRGGRGQRHGHHHRGEHAHGHRVRA